jgi:hypothetical protein
MAGEVARRYLDLLEQLESDDVMERLDKLRALPFPDSSKIYNEAVSDYLAALMNDEWER